MSAEWNLFITEIGSKGNLYLSHDDHVSSDKASSSPYKENFIQWDI